MPSQRSAAVKVVVSQCPCGTAARHRCPRRERPRRRAILVLAPVSSRKTRRWGSRSPWLAAQACRRRATSGRSCSAACAVFFEADAAAVEEAPKAADPDRNAALSQPRLQLGQGHVRGPLDLTKQKARLGLNAMRATVAALRSGSDVTPLPPGANPTDRTGNANTEARSCLATRGSALDGLHNTHAKIRGKAPTHVCWPPLQPAS